MISSTLARPPTPTKRISRFPKVTLAEIATINKFVQDLMPADVTCSKETKDLLADCCVEFIHLLSSEANEICEKETKKTIAGEHIVSALKSLGYESYIEHIQEVVDEHQKTVKVMFILMGRRSVKRSPARRTLA